MCLLAEAVKASQRISQKKGVIPMKKYNRNIIRAAEDLVDSSVGDPNLMKQHGEPLTKLIDAVRRRYEKTGNYAKVKIVNKEDEHING